MRPLAPQRVMLAGGGATPATPTPRRGSSVSVLPRRSGVPMAVAASPMAAYGEPVTASAVRCSTPGPPSPSHGMAMPYAQQHYAQAEPGVVDQAVMVPMYAAAPCTGITTSSPVSYAAPTPGYAAPATAYAAMPVPMMPAAGACIPAAAPAPAPGMCSPAMPCGSAAPPPQVMYGAQPAAAYQPGYVGTPQGPLPSAEPPAPQSLTAGIPDPESVEKQKAAYSKGLDDQLRHGTDVLAQQLKQQSEYLFAVGDQQKRQYDLQVDQQIKVQEMELQQQHNQQLLMLQHAAQQQKAALEHQANALILEYGQRKAQEDIAFQQYQHRKQHFETQQQYSEEMKALQAQQAAAAQQVAAQHMVIAHQAATATQQAQLAAQQSSASALQGSASMMALQPAVTSYMPPATTSYSVQGSYAPPPTAPLPAAVSSYVPPTTSAYYSASPPSGPLPAAASSYAPPTMTTYGSSASMYVANQAPSGMAPSGSSLQVQMPAGF
mmetsp:Transcript_98677/g.220822  ORF Transcript_98677/g.220822 Transcript_98677/m.220822 type:complete len:491 (+) Transcript_98677:2-1474(+)